MTYLLHDLIKHVRHETRLPDIVGERCVHMFVETASCRACIEACPQSAWVLNDDSLGLNTEACDGCGLCAPVCPQGAINIQHDIPLRAWRRHIIALCACECTGSVASEGVMPCIHSLGLQDILRLIQKGVRQLVVATADCAECPRGQGTRLSSRLASINKNLQKSGNAGIELIYEPLVSWERLQNDTIVSPAGPQLSRRGFLRSFANTGLQQGIKLARLSSDEQTPFAAPGQLLPGASSETLWPYLPSIDIARCNGCDACAKLCPHQAIILHETEDYNGYVLDAKNCTGCRICIDVCDQEAVSLQCWEAQEQWEVTLKCGRCSACGALFHTPAEQQLSGRVLCRICSNNNHHKNLFQVLT